MIEQHFLQISSNFEMIKLERFVELTRNDPATVGDKHELTVRDQKVTATPNAFF